MEAQEQAIMAAKIKCLFFTINYFYDYVAKLRLVYYMGMTNGLENGFLLNFFEKSSIFSGKLFIVGLAFLQDILNDQSGDGETEDGGGMGYRTVGMHLGGMPVVSFLTLIGQ